MTVATNQPSNQPGGVAVPTGPPLVYPAAGDVQTADGHGNTPWQLGGSGGGGPAVASVLVTPTGADDSAMLTAAIASAVAAGQANGSSYAEVWFDSTRGPFMATGPQIKGGATLGNAQIPLPVIPATGEKFTLVLRGVRDASAMPHWLQTVVQESGAVIVTSLNGAFDATFGSPSCIGGPTTQQLGAVTDGGFSNMLLVIDGLSFVSPASPTGVALDGQCLAQLNIPSASFNGSMRPGVSGLYPVSNGVAVRMPQVGNNDNCNVGVLSIEGYGSAIYPSEHFTAQRLAIVYCQNGVCPLTTCNDSIRIDYLSTEICKNHISTAQLVRKGTIPFVQIDVGTWDVEDATGGGATTAHVDDAGNWLAGELRISRLSSAGVSGAAPLVSGGKNVRVINTKQPAGNVAAPGVPATTVALVNPFWRDAAVTVTGAGVTAIAVDGTSVGQTTGTVFVPSGKSITLTYTGVPTWVWTLL